MHKRSPSPQADGEPGKGAMMKNLDEMQKFGKDNMDATLKSFGAVSKSVQAIAVEVADYSKKSFEDSTAAIEKLFGAKTLEKAIEVQSDYVKSAYEGFVAEATKLGELYADLAKETYKPFESYLAKVSTTK
jgi:phasin family protein